MSGATVKVYSKAKDGAKKLSANFRVHEFACQDGSDPVFVSDRLVEVLQAVRNKFGQPVNITSGYRTVSHNKKVGGVVTSQHLYGTAADIMVTGVRPDDVADYLELIMPNSGGIGRYKDFTHVDVRAEKSRFVG
jgi:uncharacterized protein YcbK (DUF882 family)